MTCVLILMKSKNIMPHISTLAFPLESKATRHITLSLCCIIFSSTAVFDTLGLHGLQHAILPVLHYLQSLPRFMSIAPVMPSSHLILWCPLLLSIFPSIRDSSNEHLFAPNDQNTGVSTSASVLPTSIQGWFPLRLTGLISLLSNRLSGVFSSTTVLRRQFFGTLLSLQSISHKHTWPYGKTIVLTIQTFVGRVMSLLFNTLSFS